VQPLPAPLRDLVSGLHEVPKRRGPFVLEGLFGEVDADAIDAGPDSELICMDIEDDAEGAAATANGRHDS
jgi:hypothetical protein